MEKKKTARDIHTAWVWAIYRLQEEGKIRITGEFPKNFDALSEEFKDIFAKIADDFNRILGEAEAEPS